MLKFLKFWFKNNFEGTPFSKEFGLTYNGCHFWNSLRIFFINEFNKFIFGFINYNLSLDLFDISVKR